MPKKKAVPSGYELSIKMNGARDKLKSINLSVLDIEALGEWIRDNTGGCGLSEHLMTLLISTGIMPAREYTVSFTCRVDAVDNDAAQVIGDKIADFGEKIEGVTEIYCDEVEEW